jgi:hypothetical protein
MIQPFYTYVAYILNNIIRACYYTRQALQKL